MHCKLVQRSGVQRDHDHSHLPKEDISRSIQVLSEGRFRFLFFGASADRDQTRQAMHNCVSAGNRTTEFYERTNIMNETSIVNFSNSCGPASLPPKRIATPNKQWRRGATTSKHLKEMIDPSVHNRSQSEWCYQHLFPNAFYVEGFLLSRL